MSLSAQIFGAFLIILQMELAVMAFEFQYDLRELGFYRENWPAVKSQQDGSCYAYAVASFYELEVRKRFKSIVRLSTQELIDCSPDCDFSGGSAYSCMKYVQNVGIVNNEKYLPEYKDRKRPCLRPKLDGERGPLAKYGRNIPITIAENDEVVINALKKEHPTVLGFRAGNLFSRLKDTIYDPDEDDCRTSIPHAVVIIGYGEDAAGAPYWIIQNSHGNTWNNDGFGLIARGKMICGNWPSMYTVDMPSPSVSDTAPHSSASLRTKTPKERGGAKEKNRTPKKI